MFKLYLKFLRTLVGASAYSMKQPNLLNTQILNPKVLFWNLVSRALLEGFLLVLNEVLMQKRLLTTYLGFFDNPSSEGFSCLLLYTNSSK